MADHGDGEPLSRDARHRLRLRKGARPFCRPAGTSAAELPAQQVGETRRWLALRIEEDGAVEMIALRARIIATAWTTAGNRRAAPRSRDAAQSDPLHQPAPVHGGQVSVCRRRGKRETWCRALRVAGNPNLTICVGLSS